MGEMTLRWDGAAAGSDQPAPVGTLTEPDPPQGNDGWISRSSVVPDPDLVALLPPAYMLEEGLLPWRRSGAATVVLCADPRRSARHLPRLRAALGGPMRLARTEPAALAEALREAAGRPLALQTERLRPTSASCRILPGGRIAGWTVLGSLSLLAYAFLEPMRLAGAFAAFMVLVLLMCRPAARSCLGDVAPRSPSA